MSSAGERVEFEQSRDLFYDHSAYLMPIRMCIHDRTFKVIYVLCTKCFARVDVTKDV